MFALKRLAELFNFPNNKEYLAQLPVGALFIVRPHSPKGYSELIFKDAACFIRHTGQEFQYQLVIQRAYEEGEAELFEEDGGEDGDPDGQGDKDEKTFLLDEELHLRVQTNKDNEIVLAWRDLLGDEGDLYEFIVDPSTKPEAASTFGFVAAQCQYERKYRRIYTESTTATLDEFAFDDEPTIPTASPVSSNRSRSPAVVTRSLSDIRHENRGDHSMARESSEKVQGHEQQVVTVSTKAPLARKPPASRETLCDEHAELHLFDFETGTFILQDEEIHATVTEVGSWNYWLHIAGTDKQWLGHEVVPDINPVFNFEYLSFIFNHYTEDGSAYSWLLKFKDREAEERFQSGLMQALWEHLNQTKWHKTVESERDYVLDAFNDLVLENADDVREAEAAQEDEDEDDADEYEDAEDYRRKDREEYDDDEDEDDEDGLDNDGNTNSQLAVGARVDRSFVVRGDKLGVFKHTLDNTLEYSTTINKIATPNGKVFAPKKVMLHEADRSMVLQRDNDPNSLYRMDLETGKVVEEWKVDDHIPVNIFVPENKFAQTTNEQTFLGLSKNALYRIDPRQSGNKLAREELKQYTSKNDFSAAATTEQGYIAVASNKGDIRMFDRLGINAKTALPALGDPIIGVDVSSDGRWILATTRTYLLLIDALQQEGKNKGKLGFEKAFAKDSKPQPRRLALTPSHVAQFQHETKAALSFTPARFNMGEGKEETTIITATGPFVVTWSLKKLLQGRKDPYSIKRYTEEVKADNFRFGSDKNIVVALPNEVDMVARRALQRPTRESIMAPPMTPRRSRGGRGSYLSRNEVVNSPY